MNRATLNENLNQSLRMINLNYRQLVNKQILMEQPSLKESLLIGCSMLVFEVGGLSLNDVDFRSVTFSNDFDLKKKLSFLYLFDATERFQLDVRFQNRSKFFVFPLSKWKVFVHYKETNQVEILLRKHGSQLASTQASVLNRLQLDEKYHYKFNVFNFKIYSFTF